MKISDIDPLGKIMNLDHFDLQFKHSQSAVCVDFMHTFILKGTDCAYPGS